MTSCKMKQAIHSIYFLSLVKPAKQRSHAQTEFTFSLISKVWKTEKDELTLEESLFEKWDCAERWRGELRVG